MAAKADFFFTKKSQWQTEYNLLRDIVATCNLEETVKWGCPCYVQNGANIVLIHGFKQYCALLFMKGALLKDPHNLLIQQSENVQSARQLRFTNAAEITKLAPKIKALIKDAIAVEASGQKVVLKKTEDFAMPAELEAACKKDSALRKSFKALTPGRQRAWMMFIGAAKQENTRIARTQKAVPLIHEGLGPNEDKR